MRLVVFAFVFAAPALLCAQKKVPVLKFVEPKETIEWPQPLKLLMKDVKPTLPMDEEVDGEFDWFLLHWGKTDYYIGHDITQRLVVIYKKGKDKLRFVRDYMGVRRTRRLKLEFEFEIGGGVYKVRVPLKMRVLKGYVEVEGWWEGELKGGGARVRVVWRPGKEPMVVAVGKRGIWRVYVGDGRLTAAVTLKEGAVVPVLVRKKEKNLIEQDAGGLTFIEVDDGQVKSIHYAENGKIWLPRGELPWARGTKIVEEGGTEWRLDVLLSGFKVEKNGRLGPVEPLRLVAFPVERKGTVVFPFELQDARGRTARMLRNGRGVRILPTVVVRQGEKELWRGAYRPG